ncbi:hypothetical protein FA15DRAFT_684987 [Coprinopsis marcescibilis]|uniref:CENP-V/GFA domain-containing protein n=1 Tax=Coprinopsis marcescibilis TaxID=230819 RepID=A0A5C3L843_COPMA|nr:hypothetical protein FA15DRAFT_684987 [Coprinopsis marcescibilis]
MTTYVKSSCHCGLNTFKIPFKTASLPKSSSICHCNICRHSTGQMGYTDVRVDGAPLSIDSTEETPVPASLTNLTGFKSSTYATRYFCTKCSAHMFFHAHEAGGEEPEHWGVLVGTLERADGIFKVEKHIYVADTLDGGLADHFRRFEGKVLPRHATWSEDKEDSDVPFNWRAQNATQNAPKTLPYHCQCKSVKFYLTRATKLSDDARVYWLVPGETPGEPIKFITAHCLCNSCRLTGGGLIQTWTMVPVENVYDSATNAPINLADADKRPQALKRYESSPGKYREFCSCCGATAIWWRDRNAEDGDEPIHIDVAVGLVDQVAAGGARAESWLSWYENLIFKDFALSKEVVKSLEDGLKAQNAELLSD